MSTVKTTIFFKRDSDIFANHQDVVDSLAKRRRLSTLMPNQLLHPEAPADFVVRRGNLRISQFLEDGREVTRAVIQSGSSFLTRQLTESGNETTASSDPGTTGDTNGDSNSNSINNPGADLYDLDHIVLMALGEVELWTLPSGEIELIFHSDR